MVILIIAAVVALIATAVLLALFNPTVKTFLVMQKLKKAESLGVTVIGEAEFRDLIETKEEGTLF